MITVSKTFFVRLIHFPYFKIGYYISAAVCSVQRGVSAMQSSSNELWETGLFVLSILPSHIHSLHYIPFILFNLFIYSWSLYKLCFVWKDFGFKFWPMNNKKLFTMVEKDSNNRDYICIIVFIAFFRLASIQPT